MHNSMNHIYIERTENDQDFSAGYSYAKVLWMQQEQIRLQCRSESILPETFKKYPLDSNPRELLIATGSKPAAERHLKEFYREMILNNFYVMCMAWFDNIFNDIFNLSYFMSVEITLHSMT